MKSIKKHSKSEQKEVLSQRLPALWHIQIETGVKYKNENQRKHKKIKQKSIRKFFEKKRRPKSKHPKKQIYPLRRDKLHSCEKLFLFAPKRHERQIKS